MYLQRLNIPEAAKDNRFDPTVSYETTRDLRGIQPPHGAIAVAFQNQHPWEWFRDGDVTCPARCREIRQKRLGVFIVTSMTLRKVPTNRINYAQVSEPNIAEAAVTPFSELLLSPSVQIFNHKLASRSLSRTGQLFRDLSSLGVASAHILYRR